MSRRKSRILAFQALYSWDASRCSLDDLLTFSWLQKDSELNSESSAEELMDSGKDEKTFASLLIAGTLEHVDEIDEIIKSHLTDSWNIDRLSKVTLAILRTSIYEIKFQPDANCKIVIDEAVSISKNFGADDSYKFINAILDKIGKDDSEIKA